MSEYAKPDVLVETDWLEEHRTRLEVCRGGREELRWLP